MSITSQIVVIPEVTTYVSQEGISITRSLAPLDMETATETILAQIDQRKGAMFSSSYEYPGRYSRWDIGFVHPAIEIRSFSRTFQINALNDRGQFLLKLIYRKLALLNEVTIAEHRSDFVEGEVMEPPGLFSEEERTKQPSIFTVLRAVKDIFASPEDSFLGLYGAFGYDLIFHLEPIDLKHDRSPEQPDLLLYVPDELTVVDRQRVCAYQLSYEFEFEGASTAGLPREAVRGDMNPALPPEPVKPYQEGKYARMVETAIESFKRGDLFEVVPSHVFYETCEALPSAVFSRLREINPSPYGFIINLGTEHLVGSSPEMYVRVEGKRVETCPISGTIKRGSSAIEDSDQIVKLLNSSKDEAELTMCTDVDRNDKSRICVPGTVKVIGRRQLEMYSHLIHTVDHVEGTLLPDADALDAFLTHMWAVTLTGAPKRNAIKWIEQHEESPRGWYGGAVGYYAFNGHLNTGITLRTTRIRQGMAEVRAGATLLIDSVPMEEEEETKTKAAALIEAIRGNKSGIGNGNKAADGAKQTGKGKNILIVDHEDSFVHTLANYFKQTGAEVTTARRSLAQALLSDSGVYDLVVLSPGPGSPSEFALDTTIRLCMERAVPIFGVCLGLQGIVEYFGGSLDYLQNPQHGKSSRVRITHPSQIWNDIQDEFVASRYHSIFASSVPDCLQITARSEDGVVMAVEHKEKPITAVQFHPESILTSRNEVGLKMIENVVQMFQRS